MSSPATLKPVIFLAFANDRKNYLYNLTAEQRNLRRALESAERAGLCEVVYETDATLESIFDVFQKYRDRVAVFHYGGHAEDYRMLLETASGDNTSTHTLGLSTFLARQNGLQLVFVNGCCSQSQALELIHAGVSAVIGTTQPIEDTVATDLSTRFYDGLAAGITIDRSWTAAMAMVKSMKGESTYRSIGLDETPETIASFPWNMHYREGAESVKDWNLPAAAKSPLFGLPEIPDTYYKKLPAAPFIGLNYFKKEYAGIFFGRGAQIRELYTRISGIHPVILFYGNSGTGKSSLLDAGLIPRIEAEYEVQYIRRDQVKGLTGSLLDGLQRASGMSDETNSGKNAEQDRSAKIKELQAAMAGSAPTVKKLLQGELEKLESLAPDQMTLAAQWKKIEKTSGKPLLILLDQVEECFTRPTSVGPGEELATLLENIDAIFDQEVLAPKGKLILAYRKEYHPEIRDGFQKRMLPFSEVYLKHLDREGIIEAVQGITQNPNTREKYRLSIPASPDGEVAEVIADDLLEDKESAVAPVLQIVLTKLWNAAVKANPDQPVFTLESYQEIKKDGVAMGEFFTQQMKQLRDWKPDVVDSGLVLDILHAHTTRQGTAGTQSLDHLRETYQHRQDVIEHLIQKCKDLYLLTEIYGAKATTGLAHDTLAPVVIYRFNESDTPGQRAARILNSKLREFDENEKGIYLDETDLQVVEQGLQGMKQLEEKANRLLAISREVRAKQLRDRKRNRLLMQILALCIVLFAAFAGVQWIKARNAEAETVNQIIRSSWKAGEFLNKIGDPDYEESGSFVPGLRPIYTFLRPIMDLEKMQSLSPVPIFVSGPHTQGDQLEVNLKSYDFGRYNVEFFKWGQEHLIPASADSKFRALTQGVYNAFVLDFARVYYDTYLFMEKAVRQEDIQQIKAAYLSAIEAFQGKAYDEQSFTGPGDVLYGAFDYAYSHAASDFKNQEMIPFNAYISPGFWIRRDIDGTKQEAFKLLEKLLLTYDADFVRDIRAYYGE